MEAIAHPLVQFRWPLTLVFAVVVACGGSEPSAPPAPTPPPPTAPPPVAPVLLSPTSTAVLPNGCADFSRETIWDFDWSDVPGATAYHLSVMAPAASLPLIDLADITTSSFRYTTSAWMSQLAGWQWKVRAKANGVYGDWSATGTFNVEPPDIGCVGRVPTLISPPRGAVLPNGCFDFSRERIWDFDWSDVPGATVYHFYIIAVDVNTPLVNREDIATSSFRYTTTAWTAKLVDWAWGVRAKVNGVFGDWSATGIFNVEPPNTGC